MKEQRVKEQVSVAVNMKTKGNVFSSIRRLEDAL